MVAAAVADHVNEAVIGDVVDDQLDLVGVALDDYAVIFAGVDDAVSGAVIIDLVLVDARV